MGMSKRSPIGFDHADTGIQLGYSGAWGFLDGGGAERPPTRMPMHRHATARTPYGPVALG